MAAVKKVMPPPARARGAGGGEAENARARSQAHARAHAHKCTGGLPETVRCQAAGNRKPRGFVRGFPQPHVTA